MREEADHIREIAEIIGYDFHEIELAQQAVTHKSFANEASPDLRFFHNERLEFLGDAVLNLLISEMLMDIHPDVDEGKLSLMRAALVNERELSMAAKRLQLGRFLRLGKGEEKNGGRTKISLLADLFEAVLGAVYLDGNLDAAKGFTHLALGQEVLNSKKNIPGFDPKSRLQVCLQQQGKPPPVYRTIDKNGPDHRQRFTVSVLVENQEKGKGEGYSKKEAEQTAARDVLKTYDDSEEEE